MENNDVLTTENEQVEEVTVQEEIVQDSPETKSAPTFKQKFKARFNKFMRKYDDLPRALQKGKYTFIISMMIVQAALWVFSYIYINFGSILLAFQKITGTTVTASGAIVDKWEWSFYQFTQAFNSLTAGGSLGIALRNTMIYFGVHILILLPLPFLISYFFYKELAGYKFFRVAIFLPSIISSVAITSMYKNVVSPNGPIAFALNKWFGYEMPHLLRQPETATWTIVFYTVWTGLSGNVLLFQGAFKRIPAGVVDACQIDGVNAGQELWYITMPLMKSTLSTIVILSITNIFGSSGPILLFTGGDYETTTLSYWIYDLVKLQGNYNLPSAVGIICTIINIPIVVLVRRLMNMQNDDDIVTY